MRHASSWFRYDAIRYSGTGAGNLTTNRDYPALRWDTESGSSRAIILDDNGGPHVADLASADYSLWITTVRVA